MRRIAPLFLVSSLVLLSACNANTTNTVPEDTSTVSSVDSIDTGTSDGTIPPTDDQTSSVESTASSSADTDTKAQTHVINVSVTTWSFTPNVISVKKGEKVVVHLTGVEGRHSFAIMDLGINVAINPGETKDVTIPTDKAGTFTFRCLIPCGAGHQSMTGQLTIV